MIEIGVKWTDLFSVQWWVRESSGCLAAFIVGLITAGLGFGATRPLIALLSAGGAALVALSLWWGWRRWYWKQGEGFRVALVFEGLRLPPKELQRAQALFVDAANRGRLRRTVSLKAVPLSMGLTEERLQASGRRLRFDAALRVVISRDNRDPSKPGGARFALAVLDRAAVTKALLESAAQPLAQLVAAAREPKSEFDVDAFQCETLFDVLLFLLGTHSVNEKEWSIAFEFMDVLDGRLEQRNFGGERAPRKAIRDMAARCLMAPLIRPASSWTSDNDIREILSTVETKIDRYKEQFPWMLLTYARSQVLVGNRDKAEKACDKLAGLANAELRMLGHLGKGVVLLLKGEYERSAYALKRFFQSADIGKINWTDLLDFATAMTNRGCADAIYLRALYTKIQMGGVATPDLESEVREWFERQPGSRRDLREVYQRSSATIDSSRQVLVNAGVARGRKNKKNRAR